MKNYPLQPNKVNWRILHPLNVLSTEEYIAELNDLYLSTEYPTDESGHPHSRFRLHAKYPHNIEQALAYDIKCPSCGNHLKQVTPSYGRSFGGAFSYIWGWKNQRNRAIIFEVMSSFLE